MVISVNLAYSQNLPCSPERPAVITLSLPKHVIAAWHPIANEDALQKWVIPLLTKTVAFVQYL